jgi:hypothetical protein
MIFPYVEFVGLTEERIFRPKKLPVYLISALQISQDIQSAVRVDLPLLFTVLLKN